MKWLLVFSLLFTGCTSNTEFGSCVGFFESRRPEFQYHFSAWNVLLSILFSETIIVPVIVVVDETFCPIGKK